MFKLLVLSMYGGLEENSYVMVRCLRKNVYAMMQRDRQNAYVMMGWIKTGGICRDAVGEPECICLDWVD